MIEFHGHKEEMKDVQKTGSFKKYFIDVSASSNKRVW